MNVIEGLWFVGGILLVIAIQLFLGWREHRSWARVKREDAEFWAGVHSGHAEALRIAQTLPEDSPFREGMIKGVFLSMEIERDVRAED